MFEFLCKLHLNEPGCEVGEHIHILLGACNCFFTGEFFPIGRLSIENRTDESEFDGDDEEDDDDPYKLTRVGEADRFWKNGDDAVEKAEVEEAKEVDDGDEV